MTAVGRKQPVTEGCLRPEADGRMRQGNQGDSVSEILALTDQQPLFGHKSGKRVNTHWMTFMKR